MAKQKVKVNGKELYTDSDEYKYLYNNNQLAAISDDPTIGFEKTAPTVEVIGEAPQWLKEKREREKYYDPNLTKQENERKYQAKKTIQGWKSADINQPGGLERAGEVMSFPFKSAGAGVLFGTELLNTVPAVIGEAVSGRGNYLAALPNPLRAAENAGITGMWNPNYDQQRTTGEVFFPNNPYAAMALDLPVDIATGKALGSAFKIGSKLGPKGIVQELYKNRTGIPNVTQVGQNPFNLNFLKPNVEIGDIDFYPKSNAQPIKYIEPTTPIIRDPNSEAYKLNEYLKRKKHLIDIKNQNLIDVESDIGEYAKTIEGTNDLTKRAIENDLIRYRSVQPEIRKYYSGSGRSMTPEEITELESYYKNNYNLDINNPQDYDKIAEIMATTPPIKSYGHRSGVGQLPEGYDVLNVAKDADKVFHYGPYQYQIYREALGDNYEEMMKNFQDQKSNLGDIEGFWYNNDLPSFFKKNADKVVGKQYPGSSGIVGKRGEPLFKVKQKLTRENISNIKKTLPKKIITGTIATGAALNELQKQNQMDSKKYKEGGIINNDPLKPKTDDPKKSYKNPLTSVFDLTYGSNNIKIPFKSQQQIENEKLQQSNLSNGYYYDWTSSSNKNDTRLQTGNYSITRTDSPSTTTTANPSVNIQTIPETKSYTPITNVKTNPVDTNTTRFLNQPLGNNPFPFKVNHNTMIDDGYGPGHNNMWMSKDLQLMGGNTGIAGHLKPLFENYEESKSEIPSLYIFRKNLFSENEKDFGVNNSIDTENESSFIDNLKNQGFTYRTVGDGLIQSFTPEKDTFLGNVTLTPEMWQQIQNSKTEGEAKKKLMRMANISESEFDNSFIHMNLFNPKAYKDYNRLKDKINYDDKYKMGGRVDGKSGMSTNPLSRLTNKNGAYGLHVEGRYGHVDGRYGHVDGRYGHVDGEKGMQVKYKKGGYLKDEDTYVTEDDKETRRGLWANVHLKNKREGKAEYGIRVINPYLWKKDYDKKHSYEEGGEIDEDDDYYNNDLVPVEIENSERVYMKKEDGSYHLMLETDKTAPRHEEGGVKLGLPEDSLVFPKRYFNELDEAMDEGNATGDWSMMDEVADKMLANAQKAYDEGKPYSSGGDSDRDLSKMRCGGCGSKMSMGGKCNRCGGGTKYGFGGALRRLYDNGGAVAGKIGGAIGSAVGGLASNMPKEEKKEKAKFVEDKSLPNWGRARKEQMMLNELIQKEGGELLAEDDIIGNKTLAAMNKYEGKGYKRPVLFSDENLALYKRQWEEYLAKNKGQKSTENIGPSAEDTKTNNNKEAINDETPKQDKESEFSIFEPSSWITNWMIPDDENKGTPESFMQKTGWTKVPSANAKVIDGDTVEINKKKYRLSDLQGDKAYFDAAESTMYQDNMGFSQYYQNPESPTEYLNTSKKTLQELINNKPHIYIKESGKFDDYGRSIAGMYYGGDNNMYHSSDSAMVARGEAIYGQDLEDSRMTERQKNISKKSKYKYDLSPDKARKKIKEMPTQDSWMDAMFPNIAPITRVKFAQGGAVTKKEDENNPLNDPPKFPILNPLQYILKFDRGFYNNPELGIYNEDVANERIEKNPEVMNRFGINYTAPITRPELMPFVNNQNNTNFDMSGMPVVNKGANFKVGGMDVFNPLESSKNLSTAQAFLEYDDYAKALAEKAKAEELAMQQQAAKQLQIQNQQATQNQQVTQNQQAVQNQQASNQYGTKENILSFVSKPKNRLKLKSLENHLDDYNNNNAFYQNAKNQISNFNEREKDDYMLETYNNVQDIFGKAGIYLQKDGYDFTTALGSILDKKTSVEGIAWLSDDKKHDLPQRTEIGKRLLTPSEEEAYSLAYNILIQLKLRYPDKSKNEINDIAKRAFAKEFDQWSADWNIRKKGKDYPKESNYKGFPNIQIKHKYMDIVEDPVPKKSTPKKVKK